MNKLNRERQVQVVKALVEGNGINTTVRQTGVAKNTVLKLLADLGSACLKYQDEHLRDLKLSQIQCDEIWEFCYAKEKNVPVQHKGKFGYGDIWTFVAIDVGQVKLNHYLSHPQDDINLFLEYIITYEQK
ncbi:MAG: hypothetical protein HYX79_02800 [Chloroflexi bacterium]|nr:hypothetical protein [Chloroflexota bacterium]